MSLDPNDKSLAHASAAINSIVGSGLPVSPQNFAVWFDYHSGQNPDLKRVVDLVLGNKRQLDERKIAELFDKHFGASGEYRAVRDTVSRMGEILAQVRDLMSNAESDARRFGSAVRGASENLASGDGKIANLIETLLTEARAMALRAQALEYALQEKKDRLRLVEQTLETARREATTDALTGLANRRCLEDSLQHLAGEAMNEGTPLCLMIADIDHFKRVNDTWGHQVGDQVIQLVASTLRAHLRDRDVPARYGGEEFAVLLPDTSLDDAASIGERLREAFAARPVVARQSKQVIGTITLSLGIATYAPGEALAAWVRRTDAALYRAKQSGRNCLVLAGEPAVSVPGAVGKAA
jgi:diguanylate cyclase